MAPCAYSSQSPCCAHNSVPVHVPVAWGYLRTGPGLSSLFERKVLATGNESQNLKYSPVTFKHFFLQPEVIFIYCILWCSNKYIYVSMQNFKKIIPCEMLHLKFCLLVYSLLFFPNVCGGALHWFYDTLLKSNLQFENSWCRWLHLLSLLPPFFVCNYWMLHTGEEEGILIAGGSRRAWWSMTTPWRSNVLLVSFQLQSGLGFSSCPYDWCLKLTRISMRNLIKPWAQARLLQGQDQASVNYNPFTKCQIHSLTSFWK